MTEVIPDADQCSTSGYPNHVFKTPSNSAPITGPVGEGNRVLISCLDTGDTGTEFTCSAGSFRDIENSAELLDILACPSTGY